MELGIKWVRLPTEVEPRVGPFMSTHWKPHLAVMLHPNDLFAVGVVYVSSLDFQMRNVVVIFNP